MATEIQNAELQETVSENAEPTAQKPAVVVVDKKDKPNLVIEGDEVSRITCDSVKHYYNVETSSPMHGKQYYRYVYKNQVFIRICDDLKFYNAVMNDNLYDVELEETDLGLSFVSFRSWDMIINRKMKSTMLDSISVKTLPMLKDFNFA